MISANYQELTPEQAAEAAAKYDATWQHPEIPERQNELVRVELAALAAGFPVAPYLALQKCFHLLKDATYASVLEVGASSGYNAMVLRSAGHEGRYVALDRSPGFRKFARALDRNVDFRLGDARALPFISASFDVVISGAVMMHVFQYDKVLAETVRVSKDYVILHRTPVQNRFPTRYFLKEAYDVPCLEIWFNEAELHNLFQNNRLDVIAAVDVYVAEDHAHRDYVLRKQLMHHPV